jgi:hypothetical protein
VKLVGREMSGNLTESSEFHAENLRHGTDGFTSPPKEVVLRIFSPRKIRRLRPGLNPRTWVLKASTQPLDHRSRLFKSTEKEKKSTIFKKLVQESTHVMNNHIFSMREEKKLKSTVVKDLRHLLFWDLTRRRMMLVNHLPSYIA